MGTKKRKAARLRGSQSAARSGRARSADDVVDVTDDGPEEVLAQVKLLCDNDTEVVFARVGARLIMRLQARI